MHTSLIALLCSVLQAAAADSSQIDTVFATEYDVVLTIGEKQYRSQGNVHVRDGQVITIEFDDFKVELKVLSRDADEWTVLTTILERVGGDWVKMDVDSGGFGGAIGRFHAYDWNGDAARLNIAIEVSTLSR